MKQGDSAVSIGFFERTPGNKSMMRLLAFSGFCLGGIMVVWSMSLITAVVSRIIGGAENSAMLIQLIGSLVLIVSGGAGLAAGGEVMKVIQQRSESMDREVRRGEDGEVVINETVDVESSGSLDSSGSGRVGL